MKKENCCRDVVSRKVLQTTNAKLCVSWDRLLFQQLSHPLLGGPTPLHSDWLGRSKLCQCVHVSACVSVSVSVSVYVCTRCVKCEWADLTHWWSVDCEAFKPCVLKSQMRIFHRSRKLGNYTESLSLKPPESPEPKYINKACRQKPPTTARWMNCCSRCCGA